MDIRFGTFEEPLGRQAVEGDWTFLPCIGQPEGGSFRFSHRLCDHLQPPSAPAVLRRALRERYDAAWVRGRLPRAFAYEPSAPEAEKTLLWETFAAVRGRDAFMFCCSDHYGSSALMFSEAGPDDVTKDAIATAFWSLLLRDAQDLADYRARIFHPGACVWLEFACEDGEVSLTETND
jgi:hypothetical protein